MQSYYESNRDSMLQPLTWYDQRNNCLPHFHAGIELVYVLDGTLYATLNGQSISINENEMLVNNCYTVHAYSSSKCSSIVTIIPLSVVPSMKNLLTSNRFCTNSIADDERHSLEFFMRMLADNPNNSNLQMGLSYSLLGYLADRIELNPVNSSDRSNIICDILNFLNDNFTKPLTVDRVAAHFGYSRSRFSHLFKTTIGYSLPQYLNMLRCRSVCEAMLSSDTPVVDLATNAGFHNAHTFYSAFKTYYHMTPREYVRSQNNDPRSKCEKCP